MIYCNLKGGLGNMMFQIAASKSLSLDNNTDCSFPNLYHHLSYLNNEINHNQNLKHSNDYLKIFNKLNTSSPNSNFKQIHYPFEYVNSLPINENVMIDGFFQSEKYFVHHRKLVIDFFDFSFINKKYIDENYTYITDKKCTSIHIRRGDYLKFPNHHPTQTIDYYYDSIEILKNNTDLFVIFSDDIQWCKENLKLENVLYIEDEKDYIELYLMSLCDNNIISNSSFSWWGAWLNENPRKKVIGPLKWFGDAIQHKTGDILPENWIKI
jgi:hypothetical protein